MSVPFHVSLPFSETALGLLGQREELGRGRRLIGVDGLLGRIFGRRAGLVVSRNSKRERAVSTSGSDFRSVGEGTVERGRFGKWEKF
jgi:hypothetical protein